MFNQPQIRDDSMLFSANFLPAGTYVLTYTLVPLQTGEYQALPAHAWQTFFPEVQGTSAGAEFKQEAGAGRLANLVDERLHFRGGLFA